MADGAGVAGIEHSWGSGQAGGFCAPSVRGYAEACPELPACPRGDILFPLHPAPWRDSQQGIFQSFPQQFHSQGRRIPSPEAGTTHPVFDGVLCPQQSPREFPQVSQGFAVPGMESQGFILSFHQEHFFGELQVCRDWKPCGAQIGKKKEKKLPKKPPKKPSVVLSVCSKGLGCPSSQTSQWKVWREGAGTFPKNISEGSIT